MSHIRCRAADSSTEGQARVAALLLRPSSTWLSWLERHPQHADLVAATFGLFSVLAHATNWDAGTLLSEMGCDPGEDVNSPLPEDLERVRDLLALTCSVVDRLDVMRDKRLAIGFTARLFAASGGDAHACIAVLETQSRRLPPPNQLLDLGEVAAAFADAHARLVGQSEPDNPFRDESTPHLSVSRLRLYHEQREDVLGAIVSLRIGKHLDECAPCRRALRDSVSGEVKRPVLAG